MRDLDSQNLFAKCFQDELADAMGTDGVKVADVFDAHARKGMDLINDNDSESLHDLVIALFNQHPESTEHENVEPSSETKLEWYMEELKKKNYHFSLSGHDIMSQRWKRHLKKSPTVREHYNSLSDEAKTAFRAEFAQGVFDTWEKTRIEKRSLAMRQLP